MTQDAVSGTYVARKPKSVEHERPLHGLLDEYRKLANKAAYHARMGDAHPVDYQRLNHLHEQIVGELRRLAS